MAPPVPVGPEDEDADGDNGPVFPSSALLCLSLRGAACSNFAACSDDMVGTKRRIRQG
jgi:hypothetical protein